MVMGVDSCSKGRGFESWCRELNGHKKIQIYFYVRIVIFVLKDENK